MRHLISSNNRYDFYLMKGDGTWYVEAFLKGTLDHTTKTLAGFSTKKKALEVIGHWMEDFT